MPLCRVLWCFSINYLRNKYTRKGLVEIVPIFLTLFSRVCITTPYLSSAKACAITQWGLTRVPTSSDSQVLTTGASAAAWSMPPHQRCGDGEVSGSDVSEGVCAAQSFIEWSTMVVPTYPEGGSHALQVCQHHHQVVQVGDFVGLSETGRTWCSRLLRPRFG